MMIGDDKTYRSRFHFLINSKYPVVVTHTRLFIEYELNEVLSEHREIIYLPPKSADATFYMNMIGVVMRKTLPWKMKINYL